MTTILDSKIPNLHNKGVFFKNSRILTVKEFQGDLAGLQWCPLIGVLCLGEGR